MPFLRHFVNYGINDVLLMLIPLIIVPLISNAYGREIYGAFVVAKIIAASLGTVVDLGYRNVGIVGIEETSDQKKYLENSTSLKFLAFLIIGFVYFIMSIVLDLDWIYVVLYLSNIEFILIPRYLLIARRWLPLLSKVFFTLGAIQVGLILFLVYHKFPILYVAFVFPLSYLIGGILCYIGINRNDKRLISFALITSVNIPKDHGRNLNYLGKNIVGILKDKLAYFITQVTVGNTSILELDIGLRLLALMVKPYSILNNLWIKSGSINKFSRNYFDTRLKWILITSIILVLGSIVLAPIMLPLVFNEHLNFKPIFILIGSLVFLSSSSFINSNILILRDKTDLVLRSTIIVTCYYLMSLFVLLRFTSMNSLYSIAISISLTYFFEFLIVYLYKRKLRWEK